MRHATTSGNADPRVLPKSGRPEWARSLALAIAVVGLQAWLDGADSPSFRTRVLDQSREVHFKDCSPQRYEGCPACAT